MSSRSDYVWSLRKREDEHLRRNTLDSVFDRQSPSSPLILHLMRVPLDMLSIGDLSKYLPLQQQQIVLQE